MSEAEKLVKEWLMLPGVLEKFTIMFDEFAADERAAIAAALRERAEVLGWQPGDNAFAELRRAAELIEKGESL